MIITKELVPICCYIRECVVTALGGEPKEWITDEQLDEFIAQINGYILSLLHDLIVMLDYLMVLRQSNSILSNEGRETLSTVRELISEVRGYMAERGTLNF